MHQRLHPTVILHYHPPSRDLGAWFWYVVKFGIFTLMLTIVAWRPVTEAGRRVPPSDLSDYRIGYDFRAPCCLCASNPNSFGFTESEIYRALSGPYEGEYVAGCAADICGYISKPEFASMSCSYISKPLHIANLERMYPMRGLLLRKYPIRRKSKQSNSSRLQTYSPLIYIFSSGSCTHAAHVDPNCNSGVSIVPIH